MTPTEREALRRLLELGASDNGGYCSCCAPFFDHHAPPFFPDRDELGYRAAARELLHSLTIGDLDRRQTA